MELKIYKKAADGSVPTTPMTAAQLGAMSVNDSLRLTVRTNTTNLQARFRVVLNGTAISLPGAVVWPEAPNTRPRTGFVDPTTKLISYYDFTITTAGTYSFEGFVSSKP
jgi:hypothetical protein